MLWLGLQGQNDIMKRCNRIFAGLFEQNIRYLETTLNMAIIEFTGSDGHELPCAIKLPLRTVWT